jgi:hypothetical protein
MPQPLPRCVDRVLNPLHVATFASEDMKSPIRLEHFIDLIFNLNFGHILTAGKRPDFLHRNTFKVLFGDNFFGHCTLPNGMHFKPRSWRIVPEAADVSKISQRHCRCGAMLESGFAALSLQRIVGRQRAAKVEQIVSPIG